MDATPTTPFKITMVDGLHGAVEVDGRDVTSQIAGVSFEAGNGDVACLTLHVRPQAGVIEGVAVIEQVGTGGTLGDLIRQLDPSQIRALHAERMDPVTTDPYQAMLEIAADLIDQAAGIDHG